MKSIEELSECEHGKIVVPHGEEGKIRSAALASCDNTNFSGDGNGVK